MKQEILLTITMLVSNRIETIEKCMNSLTSLLKKVPSELIIVDTAGNKECMDIVRNYTNHIIPFTWCNDFSAARNAGLKEAKGKWMMFLDDDEWFESTKEIENFFLKEVYKKYGSATYIVRNYINYEGTKWDDRILFRICRLDKTVHFKGKIHEYLYPLSQPTYHLKDYVHHYGYVYENEEKKQEHDWRNMVPLMEQYKENPEDFQIMGQLLQEYLNVQEYYSALELSKKMGNHPERNLPQNLGFTIYGNVIEIRLYIEMKKYQIAYDRAKQYLQERESILIKEGCLVDLMIAICAALNKYEEALEYIKKYKVLAKTWSVDDSIHYTDFFNLAKKYLNYDEIRRFELIEMDLYVKLEKWKEANECLKKISWKEPWKRMIIEVPEDIVQIILHCSEEPNSCVVYKDAICTMIEKEVSQKILYEKVEKAEEKDKQRLLSFLVLQEPIDLQMLYFHFEYAVLSENIQRVEELLNIMKGRKYSFFGENKNYWMCLDKVGINLMPYIEDFPLEEYFNNINNLYQKCDLNTCEVISRVLEKGILETDIRYKYVKGILLEKQLLHKWKELKEEEIWNYFLKISEFWLSCAMDLYRPEIFESELKSAVPAKYCFAWYIMNAEKAKEDGILFSQNVGNAGRCYSVMSNIVVRYLRYIQEEKKREIEYKKLTPEMRELVEKLKKNIVILIDTNQTQAAEYAIRQLEVFIPSDKKLSELKKQLEKKNKELSIC